MRNSFLLRATESEYGTGSEGVRLRSPSVFLAGSFHDQLVESITLISRLILAFLFLTLTGCKEPNPSFVFIENAATDKLQLIAEFDGADTASKPLIFELGPGQQDGWRFISDKKEAESFDASFRSLLVKSEKCERKT